jgi:hypothetical protein
MGALNDPAKLAGLLTLAALGVLIVLRRGFAGVTVKLGD